MSRTVRGSLLAAALLAAAAPVLVSSRQSYQNLIPNGYNVLDDNGGSWAAVGHTSSGGGGVNPFGNDFASAGWTWTKALCQMDSDGDGVLNGQELGDPACVWTPGASASRSTNISNPGIPTGKAVASGGSNSLFGGIPLWVLVHVFLCGLSFGCCVPCGALLPANKRMRAEGPAWLDNHKACMGVGYVAGVAGFLVGLLSTAVKFQSAHGPAGVGLAVMMTGQVLLGVFRPHKAPAGEKTAPLRAAFEICHPFLGRAIIVLAAYQLWTGYDLLTNYLGSVSLLAFVKYVHVAALGGIWFLAYLWYKMERAPPPKAASAYFPNSGGGSSNAYPAALPVSAPGPGSSLYYDENPHFAPHRPGANAPAAYAVRDAVPI